MTRFSSRLQGFYRLAVRDRISELGRALGLSAESHAHLSSASSLEVAVADRMSENVLGVHGLPLSVALNFRVNDRDYVVPMAVEEPSVVAAASNAARMVYACGGFRAEADASVMTAQIQLDDVPDPRTAAARVEGQRERVLARGDAAISAMTERGGGCRDFTVRVLDETAGVVVVDVFVDVRDAMGANTVDTVAEAVAPLVQEILGGVVGLRILSNLPLRRMVRVRATVSAEALGGEHLLTGIERASRFAELDVFRAVTHNKGFMNGVDAAAVALGQDWRSIEAAAHAYAALDGRYRPLSTWRREGMNLVGEAALPLAVGTAGGSTRVHAGVRAAFDIIRVESARELAMVLAAAGLASNLAALRALAGEGIQKGHMKLHHRKDALPTSAPTEISHPERGAAP